MQLFHFTSFIQADVRRVFMLADFSLGGGIILFCQTLFSVDREAISRSI